MNRLILGIGQYLNLEGEEIGKRRREWGEEEGEKQEEEEGEEEGNVAQPSDPPRFPTQKGEGEGERGLGGEWVGGEE